MDRFFMNIKIILMETWSTNKVWFELLHIYKVLLRPILLKIFYQIADFAVSTGL